MAIEGVDYAGDHPDPAKLYAAGKRFVVRYGGAGGSWKHLTLAEARMLDAAGLALVANAEGTASGLLGGWSAGADWAAKADQHFRGLGMPAGRPIYLSVDFDVTSTRWPAVRDALKGAASVIGAGRVGVYGGRRAVEWARRDGVARWFWQTYAWSAGVWQPNNHLEQYRNGVSLAGGTVDLCRAKVADYGQWTLSTRPQIGDDEMTAVDDRLLTPVAWAGTTASGRPKDGVDVLLDTAYVTLGVGQYPTLAEVMAVVQAIASRVDIDPQELAAIAAEARAGAQAGVAASVGELAAALAPLLPRENLDTIKAALGEVLAGARVVVEG